MERKSNYGPFLIIVPMSTLHNNWEYEFDRWFPTCIKVCYDGNREQRKFIREKKLATGQFNVCMTTYEFAMRDKAALRKIKWEYMIIDEAHRLKNPKCKLALELATYTTTSRRLALTGTPLQNELPELWSLLNFIHPTIFNSSLDFERWFASPFTTLGNAANTAATDNVVAMSEEEKLLVINRLHSILSPFMLRREKREVETDLADKVEKIIRIELTNAQRSMYAAIIQGAVSVHNRMVQLRKVCNHPLLFHPHVRGITGADQYQLDDSIVRLCGKFIVLDNILPKLKRTGHRILIFSQMTRTMNVMEDYFRLRDFSFLRLDGTTATEDRSAHLKAFNADESDTFLFILSTKAGGLGLNLQSADTVILFDSDWNPQNDLQAQARAHRLGQTKQVLVLRLVTNGTVEEKVLSAAAHKLTAEQMVISAGMFHERYSHTASRHMLEQAMAQRTEEVFDEQEDGGGGERTDGINRIIARSESEYDLFKQMDIDDGRAAANDEDALIPSWVAAWSALGNRSTDTSVAPVPFTLPSTTAASPTTVVNTADTDAEVDADADVDAEVDETNVTAAATARRQDITTAPAPTLTPAPSAPVPQQKKKKRSRKVYSRRK